MRNHGKHGSSRKWKSSDKSPSCTAFLVQEFVVQEFVVQEFVVQEFVVQDEILNRNFFLFLPSVTFRVFRGE